jgi:hypothetical protein
MSNNYQYYNQIRSPGELGMSGKGTFKALSDNISGLEDYVLLLIEGGGKAAKGGQPLGNSYFVNTNAKCKDSSTGKEEKRYMYINNQSEGDFDLPGGMGLSFGSKLRGIIPGMLNDLIQINPERIFDAFMEKSIPKCTKADLKVIDSSGIDFESYHVPDAELKNVSPCMFKNRKNPITNKSCENFTGNMRDITTMGQGTIFELDNEENQVVDLNKMRETRDIPKQLFVGVSSFIFLYILFKLIKK